MTVQELNTLFGKNVKYYRKKKGWTQEFLADALGIAKNTIGAYEQGVSFASSGQLAILAYTLEIDVWKLFYQEETKKP